MILYMHPHNITLCLPKTIKFEFVLKSERSYMVKSSLINETSYLEGKKITVWCTKLPQYAEFEKRFDYKNLFYVVSPYISVVYRVKC